MLRRAKSFFIKRRKVDETESLPVDCLTEKTHLARRPIVVDPDRRLVAFREPPDRPGTNTIVRSNGNLRETTEGEEKVDLRPTNFRRAPRPKTIDSSKRISRRLSFSPADKEEKIESLVVKTKEIISTIGDKLNV